ncbi:MAG: succinate dehydrogenase, cytochrome b556 subunit [Alphaproteobacteria bacterium]|nr:succinate dehydrogenase, cytochrome b556 subunit [Alphaproteobacteria bacterium]
MTQALATRNHPTYWAFVVHRVSGLALALFLPVHLYVLSLALEGAAALDDFLRWTDMPLVKVAESVLVLLLAAHMAGGLRLLAVEFLPWRDWQKTLIVVVGAVAVAAGLLFLLGAF